MTFAKAVNKNEYNTKALTANGALTNASTSDALTDLFSLIGSKVSTGDASKVFQRAYAADPKMAIRILLWARDVRGGAGRRKVFRDILNHLEQYHSNDENLALVIKNIPEYGRYDDLLVFKTEKYKNMAYGVFLDGLTSGNGLAAKWAPREKTGDKATYLAFRNFTGLDAKAYRKMVVGLTKVVESKMCAKNWDAIDFSKVPSLASTRYANAFKKNAGTRYSTFTEKAAKGEVKVTAGAIYPFDVLRNLHREPNLVRAQWNTLPDFLGDNSILPMIDVSASMTWVKIQGDLTPLDAAVSIGLYVADKQKGAFKDMVLDFTTDANIRILKGDIVAKALAMRHGMVHGSTNIEAAFRKILSVATSNDVAAEDMPKYLLIMSDMEFNTCTQGTALDTVRALYERAGYKLPRVVFWNMNGRIGNAPVKFDDNGTALVSGYSTDILKTLLKGGLENFTPKNVMLETIMADRYDIWSKGA